MGRGALLAFERPHVFNRDIHMVGSRDQKQLLVHVASFSALLYSLSAVLRCARLERSHRPPQKRRVQQHWSEISDAAHPAIFVGEESALIAQLGT